MHRQVVLRCLLIGPLSAYISIYTAVSDVHIHTEGIQDCDLTIDFSVWNTMQGEHGHVVCTSGYQLVCYTEIQECPETISIWPPVSSC